MLAKLIYEERGCSCCLGGELYVARTGWTVCNAFVVWLARHLGKEEGEDVEIDARRLWEEIPSPCWMVWFLIEVASDLGDGEILNDITQLERSLGAISLYGDTIDLAKCAAIRQAFPWERVEALLARAGAEAAGG